jgi:hypothetical protein
MFVNIFYKYECKLGTGCKDTCHLQQHFFHISEPNKGPENHSLG